MIWGMQGLETRFDTLINLEDTVTALEADLALMHTVRSDFSPSGNENLYCVRVPEWNLTRED